MTDVLHRVVYFSKHDMSIRYMLTKAEKVLKRRNLSETITDINDIIELYHIKRYIDEGLFLTEWSAEDISTFKETTTNYWTAINQFFFRVNNDTVATYHKALEWGYRSSFWELIDKTKTYKRISAETLETILNHKNCCLQDILAQSNLVKHYDHPLRNFLLKHDKTAEILLVKYETKKDDTNTNIYLPSKLTLQDKIDIINRYLDLEDANLNYVRLIVIAKNSADFKIPDTIRLKAKRRDKEETEKLLTKNSMMYGYKIIFSEDQAEPKSCEYDDNNIKLTYSGLWIKKHSDKISLFRNFLLLFEMLDDQCRINLVSKRSKNVFMDVIGLRSENEYPDNFIFMSTNYLAYMQVYAYSHYLEKLEISLADVIKETFNYFTYSQNITNLKVDFPSMGTSNLEKIRFLLPEMESLLKKYKLYVENHFIDQDLLAISSFPCRVNDVKSLLEKKYVYGIDEKISRLQYHFFSDQSMLYHVKPFHGKYQSLYDLLINENVKLDSLECYQRSIYDNLISEKYLILDSDDYVRLNKPNEIAVLKELYENNVLSYYHYDSESRSVINQMLADGLVEYESTLFSRPEINYFNYYLNKSEYTNGKDLRNKYAHGTHHNDQNAITSDYYTILMLFVLIEWKLIDDISLTNLNSQQPSLANNLH